MRVDISGMSVRARNRGNNMAFPNIAGSTADATNHTNTHIATLPSNIQAGDLILVFIRPGGVGREISTPSGWSLIIDAVSYSDHFYLFSKIASGGETSQVFTVGDFTGAPSSVALRITGSPTNYVDAAFADNFNPPLLAPSFGGGEHLWLTAASYDTSVEGNWTLPNGYSYVNHVPSVTGGHPTGLVVASRQLKATSENPSTFSFSTSVSAQRSITVAVAGDPSGFSNLRLGNKKIEAMKLGSNNIVAAYYGSTKIFEQV